MIRTRIYHRADGGTEIVRILDDHLLKEWQRENPLAFEESILWLSPLKSLDFVRVLEVRNARSRRGPLAVASSSLVLMGYSRLTADAPFDPGTMAYHRRLFYLKEEDFQRNMNDFPAGALDPQTILPGVSGSAPNLQQVERGYPWWRCRQVAQLGPNPPAVPTSVSPATP